MLGPANVGNVQPLDRKERWTKAHPHERQTEEDRLRKLNADCNGSLGNYGGGMLPSGTLDFVLHKDSAVAAKFVVVEHSAEPTAVAKIVTDVWRLPTPSVILSVTGAATALDITQQLESDFVEGLRLAAQSADAWIFTGGTDTGVMSLTGKALIGGSGPRTPCIGVTSWRKVMHKESIYAKLEVNRRADAEQGSGAFTMTTQKKGPARRSTVLTMTAPNKKRGPTERFVKYWKHEQNSDKSAALDPHHTHFILVNDDTDTGSDESHQWGDEIEMREKLENQCLMATLRRKNPLLILKESGGAAHAIALFVEECKKKQREKEDLSKDEQLAEIVDKLVALSEGSRGTADEEGITKREADILKGGKEEHGVMYARELCNFVDSKESNIHIYPTSNRSTETFDKAILRAIMDAYSRLVEQEDDKHVKMFGREKQLNPLKGAERLHVVSRTKHPAYPPRADVRDEQVPWSKDWPEYEPVDFEHPVVKMNSREDHPAKGQPGYNPSKGWADPPLLGAPGSRDPLRPRELRERRTYVTGPKASSSANAAGAAASTSGKTLEQAGIEFCEKGSGFEKTFELGAPMNPRGRTGMKGRGLLGKWGPNHAADPIVTRKNEETGHYELVVVQRRDTGDWALPGGMVDFGEEAPATVKREFKEESCNAFATHLTPEQKKLERLKVDALLDDLFQGAESKVVYRGYVDDPRNTDNAWLETCAYHFHCNPEQARSLKLSGGDDAVSAQWLRMDPTQEQRYAKLYADHRVWTDMVLQNLLGHEKAGTWHHYKSMGRKPVPNGLESWRCEPSTETGRYEPVEVVVRVPHDKEDPADPVVVDDDLFEKLRNERTSYESPIAFDPASRRPLNPRGRTGVTGRGDQWLYGPNQANDPIVTRLHPRSDKLQVVAMYRTVDDEGQAFWAIPGDLLKSGDPEPDVVKKVKDAFHKEAMIRVPRHSSREAAKDPSRAAQAGLLAVKISEMVTELFDPRLERPAIYKGYVDDPRNTDNAWRETTAYHYHCSRELGGQIELNSSMQARNFGSGNPSEVSQHSGSRLSSLMTSRSNSFPKRQPAEHSLTWLTIENCDVDGKDLVLYDDTGNTIVEGDFGIGHWLLIERLLDMWRKQNRLGLLQTVVKWGQRDLVEEVLWNHVKQATPTLTQKSFQLALILAGKKRFDKTIVKLLLSSGAKAADVFVAGLFEEAQRDGVDCFHYMEPFAQKRGKKKSLVKQITAKFTRSNLDEESERTPRPTNLKKMKTQSSSLKSAQETTVQVTPWLPEHIRLFERVVPVLNFRRYAEVRKAAATNDLVYWAILCGSFDLAKELWKSCETPLRTAIIAQYMCDQIINEKQLLVKELTELQKHFAEEANGVLDFIQTNEEARKLLQSRDGDMPILCSRRDFVAQILARMDIMRKASTLDVAITLKNQEFLAHPRVQACVEEIWKGRSEESGRVMLMHLDGTKTLLIALLPALFGLHIRPLKVNDLNPDVNQLCKLHMNEDEVYVGYFIAWRDYFKIPLVKRVNYIFSDILFMVLQVIVFFQRLCGDINVSHLVLFFWVVAKFLAEVQQFLYNPTVYKRDAKNIMEIISCVLALIALLLRVSLAGFDFFGGDIHIATDLYDYFSKFPNSHTQPSGWFYVPSDRPFHLEPEEACPWSVELEVLCLFAAISCAVSSIHLFEIFKLAHDTGVLIIIASKMLEDLWAWLKPVSMLMLAFAFVFHLLTPNYRNADTLENMSPPFTPIPGISLDFSLSGPFFLTFWALLGHAEPADVIGAPGASMFTGPILWFYELIALVMFVNLLIARFTERYQKIIDKSEIVWKQDRASMLQSCMQLQISTPSPLNLLMIPWFVVRGLDFILVAASDACKKRRKRRGKAVAPDGEEGEPSKPSLERSSSHSRRMALAGGGGGGSNRRQLSLTWMMTDDIYEATNYTEARVMDVEDKARLEYLKEEKEDSKSEWRKLKELESKIENLQREVMNKQNVAQHSNKWTSMMVARKLDKVMEMLDKGPAAGSGSAPPRPALTPLQGGVASLTPQKQATPQLQPLPKRDAAPSSLQPLPHPCGTSAQSHACAPIRPAPPRPLNGSGGLFTLATSAQRLPVPAAPTLTSPSHVASSLVVAAPLKPVSGGLPVAVPKPVSAISPPQPVAAAPVAASALEAPAAPVADAPKMKTKS